MIKFDFLIHKLNTSLHRCIGWGGDCSSPSFRNVWNFVDKKCQGENIVKGFERQACRRRVKWHEVVVGFGKAIYHLNVYHGNPRDEYYFHLTTGKVAKESYSKWRPRLFVVALQRAIFNGSTKSLWKNWLFLMSNFSRLLIKVMEYAMFQSSYCCNDNSFIRHENCERFCFYCVLSVFEQHSPFQTSCNFFLGKGHHSPKSKRCPYTYAWVCATMLCTCIFLL